MGTRRPTMVLTMCSRVHLLAAAVILALVPVSSGQEHNGCRDASLPSQAQTLLDSKFLNWRPKHLSDLGADDQRLWMKAHPKECPGIAVGHFEEPDRISYAVLLVPKSELAAGYKIVVLSKASTADAYALKVLDHADGGTYSSSGLVISKATPRAYSDYEDAKSVRLRLDGVNVEWIEKGAVLYYWSRGRYRTIQPSD